MSTASQCKGYFSVKGSSQQPAINYVITGLDVSPFLFQYAKNGNNLLKTGTKVAVLEDGPPAWSGTGELRHSHGRCFLPFPGSWVSGLGVVGVTKCLFCFVHRIEAERSFGCLDQELCGFSRLFTRHKTQE